MNVKQPEDKVTIVAGRSGIIVEAKTKRSRVGLRLAALGAYVLVVLAVIGGVLIFFQQRDHKQAVAVAEQRDLEQNLEDVNAVGDMDKLGQDSDSLIKGAADGTYKPNDKQLARAYANRGDVEFNKGDEKAAAADYRQAVKLDGSQQVLVGYNEFVARYHLGERESLLSLLEFLQKPYKDNYDTGMQEHYEQYQSYIDDIKAGKELNI